MSGQNKPSTPPGHQEEREPATLETRCPRLGGTVVPLRYCMAPAEPSPCFRILDCWWETLHIESYLEARLPGEVFRALMQERRPPDRLQTILELVERFKPSRSGRHNPTESHGEGTTMDEEHVGNVVKFFAKPGVAAVEITAGVLRVGDKIHIKGHTTDFEDTITSMQIEQQAIQEAKPGDLVGIKVKERVRQGDKVFKLP